MTEPGFIIARIGTLTSYLEFNPYLESFDWYACTLGHATVLTEADALALAASVEYAEVIPDPLKRRPVRLVGGRVLGNSGPASVPGSRSSRTAAQDTIAAPLDET